MNKHIDFIQDYLVDNKLTYKEVFIILSNLLWSIVDHCDFETRLRMLHEIAGLLNIQLEQIADYKIGRN